MHGQQNIKIRVLIRFLVSLRGQSWVKYENIYFIGKRNFIMFAISSLFQERERERERERGGRQTETEKETERDRQRERQTERERDGQKYFI